MNIFCNPLWNLTNFKTKHILRHLWDKTLNRASSEITGA